jgi:hypothetical protein
MLLVGNVLQHWRIFFQVISIHHCKERPFLKTCRVALIVLLILGPTSITVVVIGKVIENHSCFYYCTWIRQGNAIVEIANM